MEILKSNKGTNIIAYNGYIYTLNRKTDKKIYWTCQDRKCVSNAITTLNYEVDKEIIIRGTHCHNEQHDMIDAIKVKNTIKNRALAGMSPTREIISEVLGNSTRSVIAHVGSYDELSQMINYQRRTSNNENGIAIECLGLTEDLLKTHRGTNMYQYGPNNYRGLPEYEEIIILYSDNLINELYSNYIWSIDGTFGVSPNGYTQIYTISILKGHHVIPLIFAVLKNKTGRTYKRLIKIINLLLPNLAPQYIICDFELAAINAFQEKYLNVTMQGCLFHLGQNIIKKIVECGLKASYGSSEIMRVFTRALIALAFVPVNSVRDVFMFLKAHGEFPIVLDELYNYFFTYYIGSEQNNASNVVYPISLWHGRNRLLNDIPRTNNAIEGWHNSFRNIFGNLNPTFKNFMMNLKHEERAIFQKFIILTNGETIRRKKKYILFHEELINFLNERESRNPRTYILELVGFKYY